MTGVLDGDDVDYICITPHLTQPGRYVVSIMGYVKHDDSYQPKRMSEPFPLDMAHNLARAWAAAMGLDIRGNMMVDQTVSFIEQADDDWMTNPSHAVVVSQLIDILKPHPSDIQVRALGVLSGLIVADMDGAGGVTEADRYGAFVTHRDHFRVIDAIRKKAYDWAMKHTPKVRGH